MGIYRAEVYPMYLKRNIVLIEYDNKDFKIPEKDRTLKELNRWNLQY